MKYDLSVIEEDSTFLKRLIEIYFGSELLSIHKIGEGFYGIVYFVNIEKDPFRIIVKWFKHGGRNLLESQQLDMLRKHSLIKVPEVYCVHNYSADIPFEALVMEFVEGINAAMLPTDHPNRDAFVDEMVGNLIHLHSVSNEKGFGMGNEMFHDWKSCFYRRVENMLQILHSDCKDIVSPRVMEIADISFQMFDKIFSEPIKKSSLIHSDYNLWNILVDEKSAKITAVIDPIDAGWADREMDLFHLQNADGDRFGLLECYKRNVKLSELFPVKNAFYWFWDDIRHMENTGWYEEDRFISFGQKLISLIKEYFGN